MRGEKIMSGKFIKTRKIVLSMLTVIILVSQLMGCQALSKKELEDVVNNNEQVELEVSEPITTTDVETKTETEKGLPADTATDSTTEATATDNATADQQVDGSVTETATTETAKEDIDANGVDWSSVDWEAPLEEQINPQTGELFKPGDSLGTRDNGYGGTMTSTYGGNSSEW